MGSSTATRKLYLEDSYKVSFQATIVSCERQPDGRIAAILDETYFYPESGGQVCDRGVIGDVPITSVWEDDAEVVYHGVEADIRPGPVSCRADWATRFDHMQQHTGQHLLSRAFIEVAGLQTVSFHMGEDACTIDLEGGELTAKSMEAAESLANTVIAENRPVIVRTVSPDELEDSALRKKLPDGVTEVRLVEIEDFDVIGCCGTHVRQTGELGLIKVLKSEKAKGAERVAFKVGHRAIEDYRFKHDVIRNLANRFTTSAVDLIEKIEKVDLESQLRRKEVQKLSKMLVAHEADALLGNAEKHRLGNLVWCVVAGYSDDFLRMLATELRGRKGTISVVGSDSGTVICNAADGLAVDFAPVVESAKAVGGSGGGKGAFATVRLPRDVSVEEFVKNTVKTVQSNE